MIARSPEEVTVSVSVAESFEGSVSATGEEVMDAVLDRFADAYPGGRRA